MRLPITLLAICTLLLWMPEVGTAQLTLNPAEDVEICWDYNPDTQVGNWQKITATNIVFNTAPMSTHKPFGVWGLNKFEGDITNVWLPDTNTKVSFDTNITDPGVSPESIWLVGWVRYRLRAVVGTDEDISLWSAMQTVSFKRSKPPKSLNLVR